MSSLARWALTAGDHRRDNDGAPKPVQSVFTGGDYSSRDFVTQNQGERMTRGNAIKSKTHIRVADSAARDFDNYFVMPRLESI
jgi:hypothetical protein